MQYVSSLAENLGNSINDLGTSLNTAIAEVAALVAERISDPGCDEQLSQVLSQLEGVSFKLAGDEVVLDINDVRQDYRPHSLTPFRTSRRLLERRPRAAPDD